uniref:Gem-associated protein 5 TPR domain-containing protein n=1 Tax=Peronospora matthiolae TaxID=2874970 RepID=A0AAV1TZI4_9STRA
MASRTATRAQKDDVGAQDAAAKRWKEHPVYGTTHTRLLPPSANWYCSKICDWSDSDVFGLLFAFGAKNSLFLYRVESSTWTDGSAVAGSGVQISFFAHLVRGKRDRRVTSVQFLMDTTEELRLVCGGEEGSVQIWDVASLTLIEQHRKHKAEVMAIASSAALDANFVVAGDRQGRISAWKRDVGKVSMLMPISGDAVHSMAMSPHDKSLVAVGYRSGRLCLVDVDKGIVRHHLAGHDQEVQCVAWKPTVGIRHVIEEEKKVTDGVLSSYEQEVWLASSSRDKTIKVWKVFLSAAEEPGLDQVLRLPTGKQGMSFSQTKQIWLPIAWSLSCPQNPAVKHKLWSGSFDGSLFCWEWNASETNTQEKKGNSRWTPELRLWNENACLESPAAATCVERMTGLGGHAYSVSYNAATGIVAAGVGDQTIRLWNVGTESASLSSGYECDLLWKGLQSKITCVQWHPFQQSLLAYGMDDGRIGIYNVQAKTYSYFRTKHDHEVIQLQWIIQKPKKTGAVNDVESVFLASIRQLEAAQVEGQSLEEALTIQEDQSGKLLDGDESKITLWSCDIRGAILESDVDNVGRKSREVALNSTAFDWDEQFGQVAIGQADGVVKVMDCNDIANGKGIATRCFHEHLEPVTCLSWGNGLGGALLASGDQDGKIFIYSCQRSSVSQVSATAVANSDEYVHEASLLGTLTGHLNKISNLRWCVNEGQSFLASSSADGTVQVWNPVSLQRRAVFSHHVGRVLSLEWVSPYMLITGGEDQTLRIWDYRDQPKDTLPKLRKHDKVRQPQEVEALPCSPFADRAAVEACRADTAGHKMSQQPYLTDKCNSQGLADVPTRKMTTGVFHSGKEAHFSRNRFGLSHCERGETGVADALRIVAKANALTPTWLSYAPAAGMDVWREMTSVYAHELAVQGDRKAAAFHFLSIAKVRSAVACLVSGDAYEEALALIRSKLGPGDPLLHDTLWKYADFLTKRGRHGKAALALLNIGSIKAKSRAARTLVNSGDMTCIGAALDVLLGAVECQTESGGLCDTDRENDVTHFAFPGSFFISIAGQALVESRFDIAETAGQLLQSSLVGGLSPASHRLTACLLGIVRIMHQHRLAYYVPAEADETATGHLTDDLLQFDAPQCVREFFGFLTRSRADITDDEDRLSDQLINAHTFPELLKGTRTRHWFANRADHFWLQILSVCRKCGYWFDVGGKSRVQEAQEVLIEASCFSEIETAVAKLARKPGDDMNVWSLPLCQKLLRFVVEAISTSFIGALEHMREMFSFFDTRRDSNAFKQRIVSFSRMSRLLHWRYCFCKQHHFLITSQPLMKKNVGSLVPPVLHQLRVWFLHDEATAPLGRHVLDAETRLQLQALLDEVFVAVCGHTSSREKDKGCCADEQQAGLNQGDACLLRKQTLLDDIDDIKQRLTSNEDSGEQ